MRGLSKKGSSRCFFADGGRGEAARLAADGCSRRTSRMRSFCSSRVIVVTEDIAGRVAGASKSVWRGSTSRRVLSGVVVNAASLVEYEEEGSCWSMHGNPISADSRLPKQHSKYSSSPVLYHANFIFSSSQPLAAALLVVAPDFCAPHDVPHATR
eukprot:COSAG05_NODE_2726_length_2723_cov_54.319986_2_plen_155_part_00